MRALIWILILGAIGYFAYTNYVKPLTSEEKEVKIVENKFDAAVEEYLQAVRMAGGLGMGTISDADAAIRKIRATKEALLNLKRRLKDETAIEKANALEAKMRNFYGKNDLIWF
jgi:2-methylaconitate cis-trans-isomerase PrpF